MSELGKIVDFLKKARLFEETYRFTPKPGGKFESDAEHSWSVAMMAIVLIPFFEKEFGQKIDQAKLLKLAVIHDIAEIETGDTKTWDTEARIGKDEKERKAIESLTNMLPSDIGKNILELWEEGEKKESLEAKIIKSIDRIDPVLHRVVFGMSYGPGGGQGGIEAFDQRQLERHGFSETMKEIFEILREDVINDNLLK